MAVIWLQTSKNNNNLKIVYLISLLPILIFFVLWLFFYMFSSKWSEICNVNWECAKYHIITYCAKQTGYWDNEKCLEYKTETVYDFPYTKEDYDKIISSWVVSATNYKIISWKSPLQFALSVIFYISPILLLWLIIWIHLQKQIIFWFTWAKELTREKCPDIYNIVENLAISRGLPVPKIWIIEDSSINAFATGWSPKNSWIVFSSGLLHKLTKQEIEAVAAHEMTHIINKDVKVMVIINVFIWMIWTIWYILLRSGSGRRSNGKWWNPLPLLWLMLYLLSIFILPFINLAISRKKEYLADAWSVELTKDKLAMISALKKISQDSRIEAIDWQSSTIRAMFINNPWKNKKALFFSSLFSTHPSIEDRIEMLEKY